MFPPATCWPNISQSKEKTSLRANLTKIWRFIFQKFFENVENILILDWKPQLSFPRRGQLGLVRSLHHFQLPPRVLLEGWPISIFAMRKLPRKSWALCESVFQLKFTQYAETKCGCRPWHVPSEEGAKMCFVVGNICFQQVSSSTWEHLGKIILGDGQDTSKESDSPMSLQEGLCRVGTNHFRLFINLSGAGLDIFQPFQ